MTALLAVALAGAPDPFGARFIECFSPIACYPDRVTVSVRTSADGAAEAAWTEPPLAVGACLVERSGAWRGAPDAVQTLELQLSGRQKPRVALHVDAPEGAPPHTLSVCGVAVGPTVACDAAPFGQRCDVVVTYRPLPWVTEVVAAGTIEVAPPSARIVLPNRVFTDAERALADVLARAGDRSCAHQERRLLREARRWGDEGLAAMRGRAPCPGPHDR